MRSVKQKGAAGQHQDWHYCQEEDWALERMKQKIDSSLGRHIYSMRLGIVEPVFGHINDAIGIKTMLSASRGVPCGARKRGNVQWQLMNMLHNLTKIHRFGMAV